MGVGVPCVMVEREMASERDERERESERCERERSVGGTVDQDHQSQLFFSLFIGPKLLTHT